MADATDRVVLGQGSCPVCTNPKAVFKVSAKQLTYCTCNACNTQIFSRSDVGDMALRGFVKASQPAPEKTPEPAPSPAPAGDKPAATQTSTPAAPGWGILGALRA